MSLPGDFRPSATIETLKLRGCLLAQVRQFLTERSYWEVETPILSADVCVDAHIDPLTLQNDGELPGAPNRLFLQTSPEFAMKRLLAAGSGSIFQIAHAFRAGESGQLHNPEFTLVEWYRVVGGYHDLMTEVGELVCEILKLPPPVRLTYREAFLKHAELDPFAATDDQLLLQARRHGLQVQSAHRDDLLDFLIATVVQPRLGIDQPVFVYDYPATQAALAKVRLLPTNKPGIAERFELFVSGVELCNGYQELTDPDELRRRNRRQNQLRIAAGKAPLPVESRLLQAMDAGLPDCAGVALGFDRLVQLAVERSLLNDVIAFPIDRA